MKKSCAVYCLPFTVHLQLAVNSEWITDNVRKMDNGDQITGGVYEY